MHGRDLHTALLWGKLKERDHSNDIGISVVIILKWILKIGWEGVD